MTFGHSQNVNSTTKEGIMEVNEMTDEMIKPGERILIFKENMSIL